ncbi:hypothetical protein PVK06_002937 [Gossypium arboreum]|uniref:Transposase MuDR plant domain-containing protein n=1 Tax=Gossypium arboreum TaxID=29729 RepID=A0ABR0R4V6_GOSAR|nr:hypothetical protein PVK06_002937 [Gossypium arboreum]
MPGFHPKSCQNSTDFPSLKIDQYSGGLQIHQVVIETDALGEDGSDNKDCSDHEGKDFSDPDLDNAPNDINDKGPHGGNNYAPLVRNSSRVIVVRNDPEAYMSIIDPDAVHASEYPDTIPAHLMLIDPELEELFMGQRFVSKDKCVDAIKRYNMKVSVDYKVADSKTTIYVGKCWKLTEGCKWRVRVVFIHSPSGRRYENMLGLIHALLHI